VRHRLKKVLWSGNIASGLNLLRLKSDLCRTQFVLCPLFRMAELQFGTEQGKLRGMCEMRGKVRILRIFPVVFFNMLSSLVGVNIYFQSNVTVSLS
jgi:hypothetical protein